MGLNGVLLKQFGLMQHMLHAIIWYSLSCKSYYSPFSKLSFLFWLLRMYVIQWCTSNKEEWGKKYFCVWREESKLLSKKSTLLLLRSFYPGGLLKKYLRKIHETLEKWGGVISISRIYQIDFHIRTIARNIWHFEWSRQSFSDCFLTMSSEWVEMLEHLSLNLRKVL